MDTDLFAADSSDEDELLGHSPVSDGEDAVEGTRMRLPTELSVNFEEDVLSRSGSVPIQTFSPRSDRKSPSMRGRPILGPSSNQLSPTHSSSILPSPTGGSGPNTSTADSGSLAGSFAQQEGGGGTPAVPNLNHALPKDLHELQDMTRRLQRDMVVMHQINKKRTEDIVKLRYACQQKGGRIVVQLSSDNPSAYVQRRNIASNSASDSQPASPKTTMVVEEPECLSDVLCKYSLQVGQLMNSKLLYQKHYMSMHKKLKGMRSAMTKLKDQVVQGQLDSEKEASEKLEDFLYDLRLNFTVARVAGSAGVGATSRKDAEDPNGDNPIAKLLRSEAEVDRLQRKQAKLDADIEHKDTDLRLKDETIDWLNTKIEALKEQLKGFEANYVNAKEEVAVTKSQAFPMNSSSGANFDVEGARGHQHHGEDGVIDKTSDDANGSNVGGGLQSDAGEGGKKRVKIGSATSVTAKTASKPPAAVTKERAQADLFAALDKQRESPSTATSASKKSASVLKGPATSTGRLAKSSSKPGLSQGRSTANATPTIKSDEVSDEKEKEASSVTTKERKTPAASKPEKKKEDVAAASSAKSKQTSTPSSATKNAEAPAVVGGIGSTTFVPSPSAVRVRSESVGVQTRQSRSQSASVQTRQSGTAGAAGPTSDVISVLEIKNRIILFARRNPTQKAGLAGVLQDSLEELGFGGSNGLGASDVEFERLAEEAGCSVARGSLDQESAQRRHNTQATGTKTSPRLPTRPGTAGAIQTPTSGGAAPSTPAHVVATSRQIASARGSKGRQRPSSGAVPVSASPRTKHATFVQNRHLKDVVARLYHLHENFMLQWRDRRMELQRADEDHRRGMLRLASRAREQDREEETQRREEEMERLNEGGNSHPIYIASPPDAMLVNGSPSHQRSGIPVVGDQPPDSAGAMAVPAGNAGSHMKLNRDRANPLVRHRHVSPPREGGATAYSEKDRPLPKTSEAISAGWKAASAPQRSSKFYSNACHNFKYQWSAVPELDFGLVDPVVRSKTERGSTFPLMYPAPPPQWQATAE